jgi:hypothetical protein
MKDAPGVNWPWFTGEYFVSRRTRTCAVCGQAIRPGDTAIANHEQKQCAHFGCGTVPQRKERAA